MPIKAAFFLFVCLISADAVAQSIRPNHWIDDDLVYYWNRNYLWDLSPLERPFTKTEILAGLAAIPEAKYEPGLKLLSRMPLTGENEHALVWFAADNAYLDDGKSTFYHAVQRASFGANLNRHLQLFAGFYIDNQLDADSTYIGKRQNGVAAFMEQAYLLFDQKGFRVKCGRDYLVWGPGLNASLHMSDASRPFDHLYLSWKNRWIKLSYFTGSLDKTSYEIKGEASVQNRYLSGHRIEIRPLKQARIGLSETALFGGPTAGNDFAFLNPILFYTGVQFNGPQTANVLASLDIAFMPTKNLMLYSSYLLDDAQFEKEAQDDQEPAEYGVMLGINLADPFALEGLDLYAEYTRVTNRTYNGQGGAWEKYVHRNVPIGHYLGNDFDRFILGFRYRRGSNSRFGLSYEHRRRGEGRLQDEFTTPWRDLPTGATYSEPFPTGIVESADNYRFTARWQPLLWLYGDFYLSYWCISNSNNQFDVSHNYLDVRINISLEFLAVFSIQ